jgi:hypothetical protein
MPAERVLDTHTLNRTVLARQLLLARHRLTLTRAVEKVGGLQTQYAPSAYIGLWTRVDGFERPHLTRALETGKVLQGSLMRVTIHIVSARDYPLLASAVRLSRREWWMRVARARALDASGHEEVAAILRAALANGPKSRAELIEILDAKGFGKEIWEGAGLWVDMIRVAPSGTWERRRADLYGLAPVSEVDESEGLEHLVRRYLGGFGPASVGDIADWGGVSITTLKPVLERMRLRRFRDAEGGVLVDLLGQPIPEGDIPAPVRFLPTWDAILLAHARRARILPEEYRSAVFNTKNPHSFTTFLVDGAVAGIWRHEGGKVRLEPFAPIPRPALRDLEGEAERLASFLAD